MFLQDLLNVLVQTEKRMGLKNINKPILSCWRNVITDPLPNNDRRDIYTDILIDDRDLGDTLLTLTHVPLYTYGIHRHSDRMEMA
jgi:hypothetical protein